MTDLICSNWIRSPYFMFLAIWFSFPVKSSNFEYDHAVAAVVTMFWMAHVGVHQAITAQLARPDGHDALE